MVLCNLFNNSAALVSHSREYITHHSDYHFITVREIGKYICVQHACISLPDLYKHFFKGYL